LKSLLLLMGRAHEPDPHCPFNCDPCRVDQPIRPCGLFPQLPAPLPCSNPRCACARSPFSTGHTVTRPAPTGSTPHISQVRATLEATTPILARAPFGCRAHARLLAALAGALQAVHGQEEPGQSYRPTGPSSNMCRSSCPTCIRLA
jgi:hypothetical protein